MSHGRGAGPFAGVSRTSPTTAMAQIFTPAIKQCTLGGMSESSTNQYTAFILGCTPMHGTHFNQILWENYTWKIMSFRITQLHTLKVLECLASEQLLRNV